MSVSMDTCFLLRFFRHGGPLRRGGPASNRAGRKGAAPFLSGAEDFRGNLGPGAPYLLPGTGVLPSCSGEAGPPPRTRRADRTEPRSPDQGRRRRFRPHGTPAGWGAAFSLADFRGGSGPQSMPPEAPSPFPPRAAGRRLASHRVAPGPPLGRNRPRGGPALTTAGSARIRLGLPREDAGGPGRNDACSRTIFARTSPGAASS